MGEIQREATGGESDAGLRIERDIGNEKERGR